MKLPINREKSGIRKPVQFKILGHEFVPRTRRKNGVNTRWWFRTRNGRR
jgi:hypothetical protein